MLCMASTSDSCTRRSPREPPLGGRMCPLSGRRCRTLKAQGGGDRVFRRLYAESDGLVAMTARERRSGWSAWVRRPSGFTLSPSGRF